MAEINKIATEFTTFYYQTFSSSRSSLMNLYRPESMLTWEGQQILGGKDIVEKLTNLPFEKVEHKITTLDAQPSSTTVASLIVAVTGLLVVDDSPNPLQFSQIFQLIPDGGSYFVYVPPATPMTAGVDAVHRFNDIFRLNYG